MSRAVAAIVARRTDAVVVEMGVPEGVLAPTQICTYGATTANGRAAAELLAGAAPVTAVPLAAFAATVVPPTH
jgi:beta-N-acetylhexosaminidase